MFNKGYKCKENIKEMKKKKNPTPKHPAKQKQQIPKIEKTTLLANCNFKPPYSLPLLPLFASIKTKAINHLQNKINLSYLISEKTPPSLRKYPRPPRSS